MILKFQLSLKLPYGVIVNIKNQKIIFGQNREPVPLKQAIAFSGQIQTNI